MSLRVATLIAALFFAGCAFGADRKDPRDPTVIFTTPAVVAQRLPILRVIHDGDGWQFLDNREPVMTPVPASKADLLAIDRSLKSLMNLPAGWEALRDSPSQPWKRHRLAPVAANYRLERS